MTSTNEHPGYEINPLRYDPDEGTVTVSVLYAEGIDSDNAPSWTERDDAAVAAHLAATLGGAWTLRMPGWDAADHATRLEAFATWRRTVTKGDVAAIRARATAARDCGDAGAVGSAQGFADDVLTLLGECERHDAEITAFREALGRSRASIAEACDAAVAAERARHDAVERGLAMIEAVASDAAEHGRYPGDVPPTLAQIPDALTRRTAVSVQRLAMKLRATIIERDSAVSQRHPAELAARAEALREAAGDADGDDAPDLARRLRARADGLDQRGAR